jgi:UDP-N-acetylmuramoyl-tripeptide--D-alanyl-D-alanine ligase
MIILNDSYNSNINGFLNALEILSLYSNKKVIITPGIVESGSVIRKQINTVANKIMSICDFCYIIDNKNTPFFTEIFDKNNYKKYAIKTSFLEAFNSIKNEEITLLIENDLTDYYFIK